MKYAVLDNTKRNRNIGTAKQGYGRNSKFSIPQPSDTGLYFYERLQGISIETIKVHGKNITVILEDLNKDFYYSFSPEEAQQILNNLPEEDLIGLGYLIFRQPKRKELILSRAWGRLIYSFEFQNVRLPAIIMEAIENTVTLSFPKKQSVELNLEFELLKSVPLESATDCSPKGTLSKAIWEASNAQFPTDAEPKPTRDSFILVNR